MPLSCTVCGCIKMFNFPENMNLDIAHIDQLMKPIYDSFHNDIDKSNHTGAEKKRMKEIQRRQEYCTREVTRHILEVVNGAFTQCREAYNSLKEKFEESETSRDNLKHELIMSRVENDRQQQRQKADTLRIHNIAVPELPARETEDVTKTVTDYLKDANINLEQASIKSAFRPVKDGVKSRNVIVTLLRSNEKLQILRQRKTKMTQNAQFQSKRPNSFITEDLTPLRQLISYKLRQDKERISKSWSMDGKIKCLKTGQQDGEKPITIDSPYDLSQVGWSKEEIDNFVQQNLLHKKD